VNKIIVVNVIKRIINELNGNSGTDVGLDTIDVNSAPAKLFPFIFPNAIMIDPVVSVGYS